MTCGAFYLPGVRTVMSDKNMITNQKLKKSLEEIKKYYFV